MARSTRRRTDGSPTGFSLRTLARSRRTPEVPVADVAGATQVRATGRTPSERRLRRGGVKNMGVMAITAGLIGTIAIPAYAVAPGSLEPTFEASETARLTAAGAQSVEVADEVAAAAVTKDSFSITTGEEIRAAEAAARAAAEAEAAAAAARAAATAEMASYGSSASGPSVSEFLANPPYPNFDLASVYNVATQYIGTPYVYGGASPAGFDCSGFVMYVYAQFGISMPHSSAGQGAMGTQISEADAVPGDLVIMSGHDGFYAGNGMILHAPYEGASVRVQPIWTSSYHIVRIGI